MNKTKGYGDKCSCCGEKDISPNLEAFEVLDEIVCDDCADEALREE